MFVPSAYAYVVTIVYEHILPKASWNSEQTVHESNRLAKYVLVCEDRSDRFMLAFWERIDPGL